MAPILLLYTKKAGALSHAGRSATLKGWPYADWIRVFGLRYSAFRVPHSAFRIPHSAFQNLTRRPHCICQRERRSSRVNVPGTPQLTPWLTNVALVIVFRL